MFEHLTKVESVDRTSERRTTYAEGISVYERLGADRRPTGSTGVVFLPSVLKGGMTEARTRALALALALGGRVVGRDRTEARFS